MTKVSVIALPIIYLFGGLSQAENEGSQIKVMAPFQPKAIGEIPEGWEVVVKSEKQTQKQEVVLRSGKVIEVEVAPFELRPKSDSKEVFAIKDPGFLEGESAEKKVTIEALLKEQGDILEVSEVELEKALSRLDALLKTLPLSEPLEGK